MSEQAEHTHQPYAYWDHRGCYHCYCKICGDMLILWDDEGDDDEDEEETSNA